MIVQVLRMMTGVLLAVAGLGWIIGFGTLALVAGGYGKPGLYAGLAALFGLLPLGWGLHLFGAF
ncbi:MAG TPA: hypothetical protein VHA37_01905 [Candidatus Saccharimonadales bacterium]|nr:hypothetical protein [Candidatus Saccharimonadales bacterium]